MEARLENVWAADSWRVWITDRGGPHGARRVYGLPATPTETLHAVGGVTPLSEDALEPVAPTLILPNDFLKAIVDAGNAEAGLTRPDVAQAKHLDDAVTVRDRLLTIIEQREP
jgi:hypothetical protein